MSKLSAVQHHQMIAKLRADRIPAVVLGDTTFLVHVETGVVSLLGGGAITSKQRELFNLWLVEQYGDALKDSDENLKDLMTDNLPNLLGIPQYLSQNANRNSINEALLNQTPEELHARMQSIITSGEYDGSYLSTLSDITQAIGESLTELNRQEEADGEQYVSAIEYSVDGESRYITLDGKTEKEAVALIAEAIRMASNKDTIPTFSPVKLKKDQIPDYPEVMAITEWSHFSEPGIVGADHSGENRQAIQMLTAEYLDGAVLDMDNNLVDTNKEGGAWDIHSAYGFDFDPLEFEAHRKKYFEENPNETHYPADHLDKLIAGVSDNKEGDASGTPFVKPDSPEQPKIEPGIYEITTVANHKVDEDKD